jgi:hypothetical protein
MTGFSRDERTSIVLIATVTAVFAWYRTDLTGAQAWTSTASAFLVSLVVATATFAALRRWQPGWYSS